MRPDPRVLLADIDRAGADIVRFTGCMDGDAYAEDALTQAAVERKFEIIGEALNRLHHRQVCPGGRHEQRIRSVLVPGSAESRADPAEPPLCEATMERASRATLGRDRIRFRGLAEC